MKLVSYHGTRNLGDTIQSVALCRFLAARGMVVDGYYDRQAMQNGMCVNGWHRLPAEHLPSRALFVAVHTDTPCLSTVDDSMPVGARDTWTLDKLRKAGFRAFLTGCATASLAPYTGERHGELRIDWSKGGNTHTQMFSPSTMPCNDQITLAEQRLNTLKQAAVVYTSRLHVALPCIALGTPVVIEDWRKGFQPERFSLLTPYVDPGKPVLPENGIGDELRRIWREGFNRVFAEYAATLN